MTEPTDEAPEDAVRMAEAIMPDNATGEVREMLLKAVIAGIMIERGRHRMGAAEVKFLDAVKSLKDQPAPYSPYVDGKFVP